MECKIVFRKRVFRDIFVTMAEELKKIDEIEIIDKKTVEFKVRSINVISYICKWLISRNIWFNLIYSGRG